MLQTKRSRTFEHLSKLPFYETPDANGVSGLHLGKAIIALLMVVTFGVIPMGKPPLAALIDTTRAVMHEASAHGAPTDSVGHAGVVGEQGCSKHGGSSHHGSLGGEANCCQFACHAVQPALASEPSFVRSVWTRSLPPLTDTQVQASHSVRIERPPRRA